jgi:hypothetical protein
MGHWVDDNSALATSLEQPTYEIGAFRLGWGRQLSFAIMSYTLGRAIAS